MTRPVLVTGAAGFVGGHLIDLLRRDEAPVVGSYGPADSVPQSEPSDTDPAGASSVDWRRVDILDRRLVRHTLEDLKPAVVYHCAAAAHEGASWDHTHSTFEINVRGTHNLIDAAREIKLDVRILIPGSAMIYGRSEQPISEDDEVAPVSPYALSKLAQELLGVRAVRNDAQHVYLTRSFNHVGPRQAPSYAVSGFARQIARIAAGVAQPVLCVGNLEARRDFTDVRDTVRAYRLIVERGVPGRIYNVCSGRTYSIREMLDKLVTEAGLSVSTQVDQSRLRPHDHPVLHGNPGRIRSELGWSPQIPIETTLRDMLDYWRPKL